MGLPRFVLFSAAHMAALGTAALVAAALCWRVRRRPAEALGVRVALAAILTGATLAYLRATFGGGWDVWDVLWDVLPLHLCDFLIFVGVFALLTLEPTACELLYFWGCTGTLLAMVTPDLRETWPDRQFVSYFTLHGAVVVSALVITVGLRRVPRPGAVWRVWLLTNLYGAAVGLVDVAFRKNFLYLRDKPGAQTLLDGMGPWPVYLILADLVALTLFLVLDLPFRAARSAGGAGLAHARDSRLDSGA